MSNNQPPRVLFNFEPDAPSESNINESIDEYEDDDTGESNPNFVYEEDVPQVVEREAIDEGSIFDTGEPNPVPAPTPAPAPKATKPAGKVKRVMSEEHKAKLGLAREKALAVRRAKAVDKKKMKDIEKETIQLKKQKKVKELEELKEEVAPKSKPQVKETVEQPIRHQSSGITKEDLERAQYEAIVKYETLRKERKAEKKKQQQLDQDKQNIINQIKPQGYAYRDGSNKWDLCY
tara:strand:- start:1599 stop:2300 length:702 start_codon:yes stop_codon:yes gene_type:complete